MAVPSGYTNVGGTLVPTAVASQASTTSSKIYTKEESKSRPVASQSLQSSVPTQTTVTPSGVSSAGFVSSEATPSSSGYTGPYAPYSEGRPTAFEQATTPSTPGGSSPAEAFRQQLGVVQAAPGGEAVIQSGVERAMAMPQSTPVERSMAGAAAQKPLAEAYKGEVLIQARAQSAVGDLLQGGYITQQKGGQFILTQRGEEMLKQVGGFAGLERSSYFGKNIDIVAGSEKAGGVVEIYREGSRQYVARREPVIASSEFEALVLKGGYAEVQKRVGAKTESEITFTPVKSNINPYTRASYGAGPQIEKRPIPTSSPFVAMTFKEGEKAVKGTESFIQNIREQKWSDVGDVLAPNLLRYGSWLVFPVVGAAGISAVPTLVKEPEEGAKELVVGAAAGKLLEGVMTRAPSILKTQKEVNIKGPWEIVRPTSTGVQSILGKFTAPVSEFLEYKALSFSLARQSFVEAGVKTGVLKVTPVEITRPLGDTGFVYQRMIQQVSLKTPEFIKPLASLGRTITTSGSDVLSGVYRGFEEKLLSTGLVSKTVVERVRPLGETGFQVRRYETVFIPSFFVKSAPTKMFLSSGYVEPLSIEGKQMLSRIASGFEAEAPRVGGTLTRVAVKEAPTLNRLFTPLVLASRQSLVKEEIIQRARMRDILNEMSMTKTYSGPKSMVVSRTRIDVATMTSLRQRLGLETGIRIGALTGVETFTRTGVKERIGTLTGVRVSTSTATKTAVATAVKVRQRTKEKPLIIPRIALDLGKENRRFDFGGSLSGGRISTRYSPSYFAALFSIKGKAKPAKGQYFTGLEIRGL